MNKAPAQMTEMGHRESALRVCHHKANRLRSRADAYATLARVISEAELTEQEEEGIWSLLTFRNDD